MILFNSTLIFDLLRILWALELFILRLCITKNWFHIIIIILLLEIIGLVLFKIIRGGRLWLNSNIMFFYITIIVIEASLGIGLLICNTRACGGDSVVL